MISYFLSSRLKRIGRRPVADPSIKASIRESLVQAGYLPSRSFAFMRVRVAFASLGILITGFGGTASYAYASDTVLPDTPLYPVRQQIEAIEVRLAPTQETKAKVIEKQAARRKKEAHLLEVLKKPLPAVHAKILKEEREARRSTHASSTRMRIPSPIPARDIIKTREKNSRDDQNVLEIKGRVNVRTEREEKDKRSTTTRLLIPLKLPREQEDRQDQQKEQKKEKTLEPTERSSIRLKLQESLRLRRVRAEERRKQEREEKAERLRREGRF
jgi:hypothetical protein